jgi:hypothetical protein
MITDPIPVLCIYRPRKGAEAEFLALLEKHWLTLEEASLVTGEPARVWRGSSRGEGAIFVEMFEWKDQKAVEAAHHSPALMAVWEPMGALCESMEFIDIAPVPMPFAR